METIIAVVGIGIDVRRARSTSCFYRPTHQATGIREMFRADFACTKVMRGGIVGPVINK